MAADKQVTTFRFDDETRQELDRIQEQLGKTTLSQTVTHIILDYRRLADELIEERKKNRHLDNCLLDMYSKVDGFKMAFNRLLDIDDSPKQAKTKASRGSLINVLGIDDDD